LWRGVLRPHLAPRDAHIQWQYGLARAPDEAAASELEIYVLMSAKVKRWLATPALPASGAFSIK